MTYSLSEALQRGYLVVVRSSTEDGATMLPQDKTIGRRRLVWLPSIVVVGLLAGCASLPQSVNNALGTIPGISVLIDGAQLEDMAKRFGDGSISEEEARAIASRALPAPPGFSHDVAALRRAMAALMAGDIEGSAAAALLIVKHGVNDELKVIALGIAAEVEQARGRLQTAMRYWADAERRWTPLAQAARARSQPIPNYAFGQHIGAARIAGQFDEAQRLLRAYEGWRVHFRKTTPLADLMSDSDLAREKSEYLATIGNFDLAYSTAAAGLDALQAGVLAQKNVSAVEAAQVRAKRESMLRLLTRNSVRQAQFAKAAQHLQELRAVVAADGNKRFSVAATNDVAAYLMASAGEYKQAVATLDEAWMQMPAAARNSKLAALQLSSLKGMTLAMADDWQAAHATLTQSGMLTGTEDSILRDVHRAVLVTASAMIGRFDPPPESLDAKDRRYLDHLASEHGVVHFGAKVIALERRGTLRNSMSDHIKAVRNARDFSRGLRALQLSGEMRALPLLERYLSHVKESYVVAASIALGQGGVTAADLLDALTLLQRTETDEDIVAAATRQRAVAGVSAVQLRELQDLRQAARTAQRQLMAHGNSLEADPQRATQLGRASLEATDKLLAFVRALRQTAPNLSNALGPDALSVSLMQARLGPREALTSISVLKDRTHVLLLTRGGAYQRLVPLAREEARRLVTRVRDTVALDPDTAMPMRDFDSDAAYALHERLLGWAAEQLRSVNQLAVVSDGALASIPFSLLIQRPPPTGHAAGNESLAWLVQSMAVSHMPSLASWHAVAGRAWGADGASFVAWADPAFTRSSMPASGVGERGLRRPVRAPNRSPVTEAAQLPRNLGEILPRLINTRLEAEAIALALGASPRNDVIVDEQATRSSVLAMSRSGALKRKSVVMFATHGLMPADVPGLAQPALALAQEPGQTLPSLLNLDDVIGLELDADWVLLSACNTSAAERSGGDPLSGLARGFFFAGARSLLVTHWAVESTSAAIITTRTIERWTRNRQLSRAQALQQTAIDMIEARDTASSWSHPAYWAPYALIGSSAGR
jgi:CHAT domain-containing protein